MKELLNKYNAINALVLLGKEPTAKDYEELKSLATKVNEVSKTVEFDVNGSNVDLLNSIKQYIRDVLDFSK